MDKISKITIFSLISVPLSIVLLVIFVGMYPYLERMSKSEEFNPESWRSLKDQDIRWYMIDDLFSKYKLIGLSKKQIIELLGEPNGLNDQSSIYYLLGVHTSIDEHVLIIRFDKNEIVTNYSIVNS